MKRPSENKDSWEMRRNRIIGLGERSIRKSYYPELRKRLEELELYLAIVRACHVRMRPIILTSVTTICGLAPMALGLGGKSPFWAPLATAIMWGLGFATFIILSMIPAYYAILQDIGYLIRHRKRRKAETIREIEIAFQYEDLQPYLKRTKASSSPS